MSTKKKVENTENINGLCNTNNNGKKTKIPLTWVSEILKPYKETLSWRS